MQQSSCCFFWQSGISKSKKDIEVEHWLLGLSISTVNCLARRVICTLFAWKFLLQAPNVSFNSSLCHSRWGRWKDILNHGRFKWHLAERDMEVICRYEKQIILFWPLENCRIYLRKSNPDVRAGPSLSESIKGKKKENLFFLYRALLVYCLRHYKGDDKIKSFIWDLISPTKEGHDQALLNHSG